jgi:uncharacterized protein (DUF983 family)
MSDVYDQKAAALQKFSEAGADHNCPFCQGRMISKTCWVVQKSTGCRLQLHHARQKI